MPEHITPTMRALRLHRYGKPLDVLELEQSDIPVPAPGQVRVKVVACGLNPADWVLCKGFMPGSLPRGIGLDVAGTVDAVGDGWAGAGVGEAVFGVPDFNRQPSAGAADYAIMKVCRKVPAGLDLIAAATLPMAVETAVRALDLMDVEQGQTLVVNGGGTMVGFAAVQIALERGVRVIATAGETFAGRLRDLGAEVTSYGDGMVERVRELFGGSADGLLHTANVPGLLPDLVRIVGGDGAKVMSISDFTGDDLGVRTTGREPDLVPRYDVLDHYAQRAAAGLFSMPIAQTYPVTEWRDAVEASIPGKRTGSFC